MTGWVAVFAGPPGAGKSSVAALLAQRGQCVHLEMDAVRLLLLPDSSSTRENRLVAYRAIHLAAELLAACGANVVLDASYGRGEDRAAARDAALRSGARFQLVEFQVPLEVAQARCRARRNMHPGDDLTPERVRELVTDFRFTGEGLVVDGTEDLNVLAERVSAYTGLNLPSGKT